MSRSLKHFLADEWKRDRALKRGGQAALFSLDFDNGESRLQIEPMETLTAEKLYERQWALTLLDRVLRRLQAEYERSGRRDHFQALKPFITGQNARVSHATVAKRLGINETATRAAVYRLRRRYRQLLHREIAETVTERDDVEDEIRSLMECLAS